MFLPHMKIRFFAAAALIFTFAVGVFGQMQAKTETKALTVTTSGAQILPLAQVKEGMRGTALTVFRGTEPEEFNVEILGILPSAVGPRQDLIIGKISGGGADRTHA